MYYGDIKIRLVDKIILFVRKQPAKDRNLILNREKSEFMRNKNISCPRCAAFARSETGNWNVSTIVILLLQKNTPSFREIFSALFATLKSENWLRIYLLKHEIFSEIFRFKFLLACLFIDANPTQQTQADFNTLFCSPAIFVFFSSAAFFPRLSNKTTPDGQGEEHEMKEMR